MTINNFMRDEPGRQELRNICAQLPSGIDMVEVGVYAGESTLALLECGKFKRYVVVDPWIDDYDSSQCDCLSTNHRMTYVEQSFRENVLSRYPFVEIIKASSTDAAKLLNGQMFDVCYIDADHRYEFIKEDILNYMKLIRPGGFMSGHDYNDAWGVKRAVDEIFPGGATAYAGSWLKQV